MSVSSQINDLIEQTDQMLELGKQVQDETLNFNESRRKEKIDELNTLYRPWYRQAVSIFSDYDRHDAIYANPDKIRFVNLLTSLAITSKHILEWVIIPTGGEAS